MENKKLSDEMIEQIELFKSNLSIAAEEVIGNLYTDIAAYIESDTAYNFKNEILRGLKDYSSAKKFYPYDYKDIRKKMFSEYRSEIVADLNADLLAENEQLKKDYDALHYLYRQSLR